MKFRKFEISEKYLGSIFQISAKKNMGFENAPFVWFQLKKNHAKMVFEQIQIHVAQNVGKVWISRKKTFPAPFGDIPGHFLRGPENSKNEEFLLIFLGGPMGPIHPVWGHVLVSFSRAQSE